LLGASEESQNAVIEETSRNNLLRGSIPRSPEAKAAEGEPTQQPLPTILISPPSPPPSPKSREKALSLSLHQRPRLPSTKGTSRRRVMEASKAARDATIASKRIAQPLVSNEDSSSGSAKMTDQEENYITMLREYTKSSDQVNKILENKETIIRSSARGQRNSLIQTWNDYCDSVHQFLEAMVEDGGPQTTYDTTYDLFMENKVNFERLYKELNEILDKKKKISSKEKHEKIMRKMDADEETKRNNITSCSTREINEIVQSSYIKIVELTGWLEDYANHVLTPKTSLSHDQVIEVTNAIEEKLALSKKKEKMLNNYLNTKDKNHREINAHVKTMQTSANATLFKILCIRDAGEGVQARPKIIVPQLQNLRSLDQTFNSNNFPATWTLICQTSTRQ
jgi:hypothetical protein